MAPKKALLTGDMQFMRPQFNSGEVKSEMATLRQLVIDQAPYTFVKLSHHGATNGQDIKFIRALGSKLLAISTGSNSGKHPTEPTLTALQTWRDESSAQRARVDINGHCTFIGEASSPKLRVERNTLNNNTTPAKGQGDSISFEAVAPPATITTPSFQAVV